MPIFAPVYRPTRHHDSLLTRQQRREDRKRKRTQTSPSRDGSATPTRRSPDVEPTPRTASTVFHPLNRTDPYHVAGHPREAALPPSPFPHAAVRGSSPPKASIEEELAGLHPPVATLPRRPDDQSTSLRRRHLDNLTTILHRCMLNGDWPRASRAWGLLIRTEIAGRGIDVRRNGRWGIGAELLMRRGARSLPDESERSWDGEEGAPPAAGHADGDTRSPHFSDVGFALAREYYERLILQYAHSPRTSHTINATAFYPALFNMWIYEVQDRSKRARQRLTGESLSSIDDGSVSEDGSESNAGRKRDIRSRELDEALPIAHRMDDLLLSPPYDADASLLQLRGMVGLWIADLYGELAKKTTEDSSDDGGIESPEYLQQADEQRSKARTLFRKLATSGVELPEEIVEFIDHSDADDDEY